MENGLRTSPREAQKPVLERFIARQKKDLKSCQFWRACMAEYLGVLLLTFLGVAGGLYSWTAPNSSPPSSVHVALQGGLFIGIIIATLTTVSGGHVNPAISIGFLLKGDITLIRFIFYTCAHVLGAISGAALLKLLTPDALQRGSFGVIQPGPSITEVQAVACEFVITFLLLFGTFALLDEGRNDVQGSVPLMIGLIVVMNILAAWNISGGCMNPARQFGPAVVTGKLEYSWMYWVGPMSGASCGTLLYDRVFSTRACKICIRACARCGKEENEEDANDNIPDEQMKIMSAYSEA